MSLLDDIRDAAGSGLWSRGVKLARTGAVVRLQAADDEIVLKVVVPGGVRTFTVHLWPGDEDWACDCPSERDACGHVAAGVIAWNHFRKTGGRLPATPGGAPKANPATVGYRLYGSARGFRIDRVIVHAGHERPLTTGLAEQGRSIRVPLLSTPDDLAAEAALTWRRGATIERARVPRLLTALAGCGDVTLDGGKIRVSGEPVVPIGLVDDDNGASTARGFVVRIVRDPTITRVLRNGAVLCGDLLRPVGDGGLSRSQHALLSRGATYSAEEVGHLVAEVLPALRKKIPVRVRTARLPTATAVPPRLLLDGQADGGTLVVRARLVYGDPPSAEVERGELNVIGKKVPIRDLRAEQRLLRQLGERLGIGVGPEYRYARERAVRFSEKAAGSSLALDGSGWRSFRRAPEVTPRVWMDGESLQIDLGGANPSRMIDAWLAGERLVQVDGGWAPLPVGWLDQYGHLVADLLAARDPRGELNRAAVFDAARLMAALNQPPPPQLAGLQALAGDFDGIPVTPLPDDLTADLRGYQRRGVDWLGFLRASGMGGILADDMGLGKTLQALCAVTGRSMVVAPRSVLTNWEREACRFRPGLRVAIYHGTNRRLDPEADLTITTYGLLRRDIELLSGISWQMVVLDEGQAIKNPESNVARAAFRLNAAFRIALTGTPVENRLDELWSQMHFVNPGLLGGRRRFDEMVSKPIAAGEAGVAARLRERLRPFVLRRLKQDVAPELPPRTQQVLHCQLSIEERAVYDAVRAASRSAVLRQLGQGGNVMAALEALLRLRQASCHRSLVPGQEAAPTSSKLELLTESLTRVIAAGHRSLVFSQWTSLLDLTGARLKREGISFLRLDGSTRNRGELVDRFQADDGPPVFLISLKAGGTGLNLTAADHVFLLDPWWNPAVEDQAADRAHRIGQDKPVMVFRLVAEDTVEERILALQERKRALAQAALAGADQGGGLTRNDLLALLE